MFRRVTGNRISEENSSARFECNGGKKEEKREKQRKRGIIEIEKTSCRDAHTASFRGDCSATRFARTANKGLIFIVVSFTGELDQRLRFNNARETD